LLEAYLQEVRLGGCMMEKINRKAQGEGRDILKVRATSQH
jgi:hypothetical protein